MAGNTLTGLIPTIKAVTTIRGNYSKCRSFRISLLYPVKESVNGKGMGYRTVNICRDD